MNSYAKLVEDNSSIGYGNANELIQKETKEETKEESNYTCVSVCCYKNGSKASEPSAKKINVLTIKVLGSGRKNCTELLENVYKALEEMNYTANVAKVTDYIRIRKYGIISTPALIVNEDIVSTGKVLEPKEIIEILEKMVI